MENKLHAFLQSGLLEKYLVGDTSIAESMQVEHYIDTYPEVKNTFDELQTNLEIIAKANAVEAPKHVLNEVLKATHKAPPVVLHTEGTRHIKQRIQWYSIAASVAAVIFAVTSFILYQQNQLLNDENQTVVDEIFDLRSDIENNNSKLNELSLELQKLNNPDARKYVLTGNERAKNLKTVAYINPVEKTSMIDVITLPQLPEEHYYQIWAELQDKMVNLGILDASERKLKPIPYMEDALALSITIESKDSNSTIEDKEVAEISLRDN